MHFKIICLLFCNILAILASDGEYFAYDVVSNVPSHDVPVVQLLPERVKRSVKRLQTYNEPNSNHTANVTSDQPELKTIQNIANKTLAVTNVTANVTQAIITNVTAVPSVSPKIDLIQGTDQNTAYTLSPGTSGKNTTFKTPLFHVYYVTSFNKPTGLKFLYVVLDSHPYGPDNVTQELLSDGITNKTLAGHNITETYEDHHAYYNSSRTDNPAVGQHYWVNMTNRSDVITHQLLSESHRRAVTVQLPFKFPFYGNEIENVTIATGGFLYTGDYIHSWLAATQYIAPLMANFDTSLSNDSYIKYTHNATSFTVLWENVSLQDKPNAGNFTFEVTLLVNGDIIFVYKDLPNITAEIQEDYHPVKVGLSDAYILDRTLFFVRRKTIFEYHRVMFDKRDLKNWTMIYLKALPTCHGRNTCESCLAKDITFNCHWCDNRCSTGFDRKRYDWMKKECEKKKLNETKHCSLAMEKVPTPGAHKAPKFSDNGTDDTKSSVSLIFFSLLSLGCITSILIWTLYAYRNPHSTSGQILIRYRPSQWTSWRKGEARYTAATIHM